MDARPTNGHAREDGEQGVTYASLQLTLPATHCVRIGEDSRAEDDSAGKARRMHCVSTRVNEDELARLRSDARARHQRMGALLRTSYFDGGALHVPAVNVEKWHALAVVLADLQRLALCLNAGQLPGDVRPVLAETAEQVHALRAELVGQHQATAKGESEET